MEETQEGILLLLTRLPSVFPLGRPCCDLRSMPQRPLV
jgi:hypothetical protein